MFAHCTPLKVIRFDVNEEHSRNETALNKRKTIGYDFGQKDDWNFLRLICRINVTDPKTNNELLGYLGERVCVLKPVTPEQDKPMLVEVIADTLAGAETYCRENTKAPFSGYNEIDVTQLADEILAALKEKGLYA